MFYQPTYTHSDGAPSPRPQDGLSMILNPKEHQTTTDKAIWSNSAVHKVLFFQDHAIAVVNSVARPRNHSMGGNIPHWDAA